jgi:Protein of unknown function (DUF3089)
MIVMKRIFVLFCILFFSFQLFGQKSNLPFEEDNPPPQPDYSLISSWACLPSFHNLSDSTPLKNMEKNSAEVDVFFIYPTSYVLKHEENHYWNADVRDEKINQKTLTGSILNQASVFNVACKIYAPYYRQAHLAAFFDAKNGYKALDLAYTDVKKAFEYYLKNFNKGRPIIIASHSQGTVHAARLLKEFFDNQPLSKKLVAAYLVGMPIVPDSFKQLQPCHDSTETGCYCTWSSFKYGYTPSYYKVMKYNHAVCTNPLSWKIDESPTAAALNQGGVLDKFSVVYPALCDAKVHRGILWVHPPYKYKFFFKVMKIYHIVDYNLFYMNIRNNVKCRVKYFLQRK